MDEVVPVSQGGDRLLSDSRTLLDRRIQDRGGTDFADRMFAAWVLGPDRYSIDDQSETDILLENRTRNYRAVAALGYAADRISPACPFRTELGESLTWLSQRPMTIVSSTAGFVLDPVALLGIALGAACSGNADVENAVLGWMTKVLSARSTLPAIEPWERILIAAVGFRLRMADMAAVTNASDTADCRITLRARGVLPQPHAAERRADEASLVQQLLDEQVEGLGFTRAVLRAGAFDALRNDTAFSGVIGRQESVASHTGTEGQRAVKKIFVSYSWDSPEHQQRVLRMTNDLRGDGFGATMDLFEQNPPEGLPEWMLNKIRRSDYVLMVITETYRKRFEGDEEAGKGKGVKWEGGIITRSIYNAEFQNGKFIPVIFDRRDIASIPTILVGNTYFNVAEPQGVEDLVRLMSDQPAYVPAPIGRIPNLPPRT